MNQACDKSIPSYFLIWSWHCVWVGEWIVLLLWILMKVHTLVFPGEIWWMFYTKIGSICYLHIGWWSWWQPAVFLFHPAQYFTPYLLTNICINGVLCHDHVTHRVTAKQREIQRFKVTCCIHNQRCICMDSSRVALHDSIQNNLQ